MILIYTEKFAYSRETNILRYKTLFITKQKNARNKRSRGKSKGS